MKADLEFLKDMLVRVNTVHTHYLATLGPNDWRTVEAYQLLRVTKKELREARAGVRSRFRTN